MVVSSSLLPSSFLLFVIIAINYIAALSLSSSSSSNNVFVVAFSITERSNAHKQRNTAVRTTSRSNLHHQKFLSITTTSSRSIRKIVDNIARTTTSLLLSPLNDKDNGNYSNNNNDDGNNNVNHHHYYDNDFTFYWEDIDNESLVASSHFYESLRLRIVKHNLIKKQQERVASTVYRGPRYLSYNICRNWISQQNIMIGNTIRNKNDWNTWINMCESTIPNFIPKNPEEYYKECGSSWISWDDFLSIKKKQQVL